MAVVKKLKKPCPICGKLIKPKSTLCHNCSNAFANPMAGMLGEKHRGWKGGKPHCVECGKLLTNYGAKRCKKCLHKYSVGEHSVYWKGGITPLHITIRNIEEGRTWRFNVFIRDNFTCQECGKPKGGELNAHHKKPFSIILNEFLSLYSQFSPIEDKETLARLAISYKPFWDLNNGITLCEECHDKTHKKKEVCV
jgi:hypothetical protein